MYYIYYMDIYVYGCGCVYSTAVNEKQEGKILKEGKEDYIGEFVGRKGKVVLKNKKKYLSNSELY